MRCFSEDHEPLFGTDGVRGHANRYPMTVEMALALGRAAAIVFRRKAGRHRVVIGKDTRASGYMFESALIAGFCSMGVDTLMVGPLPTPGVAYFTRAYRADAGVVISASHNPYYDNGIKFFTPDGFKLSDELEQEIEQVIAQGHFSDALPADQDVGKNTKIDDAQGRYVEFVKSTMPRHLSLDHMKIVLDCAHGAGHRVAPLVFRELGAEVITMGVNPDGRNINLNCGALHPEEMARRVVEEGAHVGIALDGDGDRLVMADEKGEVIDGDVLLAICARDYKQRGLLRGDGVVGTIMTNLGVARSLEAEGIALFRASVGDRHVLETMLKKGANLGGEQSGHLLFTDYSTTGDGLVAAVQLLRIMVEREHPLSALSSFVHLFPQAKLNIAVRKKPPLVRLTALQDSLNRIKANHGDRVRALVRYSGTEPTCRVMVEGDDPLLVSQYAGEIASLVQDSIGVS